MKIQADKTQELQNPITPSVASEPSTRGTAQLMDNRASTIDQRKLQGVINSSMSNTNPVQRKANKTGLPDHLKSGIENLSGYSMDDVKVHYNSSKPAQLQAHAYAQGTDIHLAPGQQQHLPHEAWHVVQQKQGRVKPTRQLKSKVNINDDASLEKEADVMGEKALQLKNREKIVQQRLLQHQMNTTTFIQLKALDKNIDPGKLNIVGENHNVSDKRTRRVEQIYVNEKFNTRMSYWTEDELHHDIDSLDNVDRSFYGDSRVLRFLDRLCFLLVMIGGYRKAKKTKDILELFHGIKNEMRSLELKKIGVVEYEHPETIDNEGLLEFHNFLKAEDNKQLFTEIKDMDQGPLFEEKLNEVTDIIENLVNKYLGPNIDRRNPLTAAYLYKNRKKYQKRPNSYSTRRGYHMQRFAHQFGLEHPGIWKIGNAHIQQISDYEDSLEDFERENYTLINKKTFDYPFTMPGIITNGIYNFGKRIKKGKD
ncbi:eCIS core domain-containing protein [Aquimarina algiphila]|uniref:eCIS core domain-containing protein n=1 Tax=Aquimarina algiphila TaxID=2047982 RepID=UPI00232FD2CA|nr:DUF4157 domain-containing protein [Aquimarina algiphila]